MGVEALRGADITKAAAEVSLYKRGSLRSRIAELERAFVSTSPKEVNSLLKHQDISIALLSHALVLKEASAQVNEVVHSLGILRSLPHILEEDERIESLSLAAGNTGRSFDLETDRRIAEFKFIHWKGSDSVREDSLFKDFYQLAEYETPKAKYLYVVGIDLPAKFLAGGRACKSVLAKHKKTWIDFSSAYGDRFQTVGSYFEHRRKSVRLVDLGELLPELHLPGLDIAS